MADRLELLRVFCITAEARSFREAAARLGVSPQVVSRAISELESRFGESLFHRNTRNMQITAFGERLAQQAAEAVGSIDSIFGMTTRKAASSYAGVVRLTVPGAIGRICIVQALRADLLAHPEIQLDLRLSDQLADVVDEQIDIGVRIGRLADNRFVAKAVGKVSLHVVAAPSLVQRARPVATPADLHDAPTSALIDRSSGRPWPWVFRGEQPFIPNRPSFITDDPEAECAAALSGLCFAQMPGYLAIPHLQAGRLVSVVDAWAPKPWTLYVYRARRMPTPPRVRFIFDRLVEIMAQPQWLPYIAA
ncbi:LysR family transcriptional regulator [Paraburkholderia sp.]|uniref:LysR family transcriptional regulator n=1 Tax=Paraburkholderia sp. TaxID=1926495 RepID=UPI00238D196B|nr:LysR family transcriptional regulator [Paraburkholderia sp.]MDE1181064.1 LysR family transcriptional regulator [Paraburkholderia sp.]